MPTLSISFQHWTESSHKYNKAKNNENKLQLEGKSSNSLQSKLYREKPKESTRTTLVHISVCISPLVMPNSLCPHGLKPAWLLCFWNSLGNNIGVGCISFSRGHISEVSTFVKYKSIFKKCKCILQRNNKQSDIEVKCHS